MRLKTYFLFTFLICATLLSACVDTDKSQGGERVDYSASSYSGSGSAASAVIAPESPKERGGEKERQGEKEKERECIAFPKLDKKTKGKCKGQCGKSGGGAYI